MRGSNYPISIYLTTIILTLALIAPNVAQESHFSSELPLSSELLPLLEAPKSPFLDIEHYAENAAIRTGIDVSQFRRLITCESNWDEEAKGDRGTSLGILQFKKDTFALFAKKYGIANPDISDTIQQIDLAVQMIRDGYLFHWENCARKIGWKI